jgi:hypothetical protein
LLIFGDLGRARPFNTVKVQFNRAGNAVRGEDAGFSVLGVMMARRVACYRRYGQLIFETSDGRSVGNKKRMLATEAKSSTVASPSLGAKKAPNFRSRLLFSALFKKAFRNPG